jgi:hypothetical protein
MCAGAPPGLASALAVVVALIALTLPDPLRPRERA